MPFPTLDIPLYPAVPFAQGVPPLRRATDAVVGAPAPLVSADSANVAASAASPTWGIYRGNALALEPDSFAVVDYMKEYRVSDYPQEKGAFESYNKVARPYDLRLTVTKGGVEAARAKFLADVETLEGSLDLLNVVTPEKTYLNANLMHVDYRRTSAKGVTLLTVDLYFIEIRTTVGAEFSSAVTTQTPSGAAPQNVGTVAARPLTPTESAAFSSGADVLRFLGVQ